MFLTNEQFSAFFQNLTPANNKFANAFQNLIPTNDQSVAMFKANAEKQVAFFTSLSESAVDAMSKVAELNINACKASLEESKVMGKQLLAAKDPQEVLQLFTALQQPTLTKLTAYRNHLGTIASGAQATVSTAIQAQVNEATRQINDIIDTAAKNAPAGSESVVAIAKSVIANASAGYDHLNKATRQAAEVIQTNVSASVDQATQVADQMTATVARTRK